MSIVKGFSRIFLMYVACVGFVTFPLFILEEAIQMATWGTWAAKDAKDARLQLSGVKVIDRLNTTMATVNRTLGWIQPLSMLGYDGYAQATEVYVQSVKAKLLAQEPDVFEGERVSIWFTPREIKALGDGLYLIVNGRIAAIVSREPDLEPRLVQGVMRAIDGHMTVVKEE